MKICFKCGGNYLEKQCPACNYKPDIINGFPAFAPSLAMKNDGFPPNAHDRLAKVEEGHFWFESRNRLIIWAIQKYFFKSVDFCEVGCGTGFVFSGIADAFPNLQLSGSEIYSEVLAFTQTRLPDAQLFQADVCNFPFANEFDLIGAFDVLEHIEKDTLALENMYSALKPGGGVLITVPQHKWLWSVQDEIACHKRRYARADLIQKVEDTGFEILKVTSFISLLLPLMFYSRLRMEKEKKETITEEFQLSSVLNCCFSYICSIERRIIQCGFGFPIGGSLLVIGRKK